MSQALTPSIKPSLAEEIPAAWIAQVREVILRDGCAIRAGFPDLTIEVQLINRPETWQPLNLSTNTCHFATEQDRDAVLKMLTGESPIPE
jgi:hypothetical protein